MANLLGWVAEWVWDGRWGGGLNCLVETVHESHWVDIEIEGLHLVDQLEHCSHPDVGADSPDSAGY